MTREDIAALAGHTPGPWEVVAGRHGEIRVCATYPCINGLSALFSVSYLNVPEESEREYTDNAFNPDVAAANAALIAAAPALLAEALRLHDEVERMRGVYWKLRSYAVHDDGCKLNKGPRFIGPCSCGLAETLAAGAALEAQNG